jgi:hypothetical protein
MSFEIPDTAICLGCGYRLRGLSVGRCPECGREFDPGASTTFGDLRLSGIRRWFAKPPRLWHVLPIGLLTGAWLYYASKPPAMFQGMWVVCLALIVFPAAIIDHLWRITAIVRVHRRLGREDAPRPQRQHWRWAVTPICFLALASVFFTNWPARARFAWSRNAFEEVAESYLAGKAAETGPQQIGLYQVKEIGQLEPESVYFLVGYDWVDYVGFVYYPNGCPTKQRGRQYLARGWYVEWW